MEFWYLRKCVVILQYTHTHLWLPAWVWYWLLVIHHRTSACDYRVSFPKLIPHTYNLLFPNNVLSTVQSSGIQFIYSIYKYISNMSGPGAGFEFKPYEVSWLKRDVLLFANTIGCTADELQFLYVCNPKSV